MKKIWIMLITILVMCGIASAQDLILEKNPEEIVIFAGDSSFYQKETWMVELQAGENIYSWGKPFSLRDEDVFIQVEGGQLVSTINDSSHQNTLITIVADEQVQGKIFFTFPLSSLSLNYLYQYFWEPGKDTPVGLLLVDIMNQSQESIRNTLFVISGKGFILDLESYETKRLVVDEFQVVKAEKISRYNPRRYYDSDVHFFWDLLLPHHVLFPAKGEYFEKSASGVVFMGENYLSGVSPKLEMEVGKSNDITVKEKIEKQEKLNQVYNKKGQEVLYDTLEKKIYTVANRSAEKKKIEIYVPLQPGYELVAHSHPLDRIESDQISFSLEIEPQQEIEVALELAGKNLTSGFVFRN